MKLSEMRDKPQPKPIPMKKTYQGPAGTPRGAVNEPSMTYGGKPLKGC